jgi:glutaredoxin
MKKFIGALARHERAQQEVQRLKSAIGAALSQCPISVKYASIETTFEEREKMQDAKGRTRTHLWHALTETVECDSGYFMRRLDDGEISEYLAYDETGCPHCLEAWRLIQQRKVARQELGIAKRALRTLGKSAIKMVQP